MRPADRAGRVVITFDQGTPHLLCCARENGERMLGRIPLVNRAIADDFQIEVELFRLAQEESRDASAT